MATKKAAKKAAKKKTATAKSSSSSASENGKICAILMYFFPIGQIWYLLDESMKADGLAKFHLKQSLVLILTYIAINIVTFIFGFLWFIGQLILLVLWIYGLVHAIKGEEKQLPVVGQFASHFKF